MRVSLLMCITCQWGGIAQVIRIREGFKHMFHLSPATGTVDPISLPTLGPNEPFSLPVLNRLFYRPKADRTDQFSDRFHPLNCQVVSWSMLSGLCGHWVWIEEFDRVLVATFSINYQFLQFSWQLFPFKFLKHGLLEQTKILIN